MKKIQDAQVEGKRILVRVDFNVPLKNSEIIDDNRIISALPTLKYLLEQNAQKIILISHLGEPKGEFRQDLKIEPIREYLYKLIDNNNKIELLENIRFDKREEENDLSLAKELATQADIFIEDAFAACHRAHASTVGVTKFLPSYAGLLVQKELNQLNKILNNPPHPYILISGGAKVKDKAPLIEKFLNIVDLILIGGLVANEFLANNFYQNNPKVILPIDGLKDGNYYSDIGVKTIALFKDKIKTAKTIFLNGNLGKSEEEIYQEGTLQVFTSIKENSQAIKIASGGDTVGFINTHNLSSGFTFLSSGGGATMQYLAGEKLPGIEALN